MTAERDAQIVALATLMGPEYAGWIAQERAKAERLCGLTKDWREHVVAYYEIGPYVICELSDNDFGKFRVFVDGTFTHRRYGSLEAAILGAVFHRVDDQGRAAECALAMRDGLAAALKARDK